jgi:hypothetical protein
MKITDLLNGPAAAVQPRRQADKRMDMASLDLFAQKSVPYQAPVEMCRCI